MNVRLVVLLACAMLCAFPPAAQADDLAALEIYEAAERLEGASTALPPATMRQSYRYDIEHRPGRAVGSMPERRVQNQRLVTNHRSAALVFPIPSGARLTSPYGYRRDPFSNRLAWHNGIDLAADTGTTVVSAHSGWCSQRYSDQSGWVIRVSSPHLVSEYRHLSAVLRDSGFVRAGETIGAVGATGQHCTGPHLHFTLTVDGAPVDPAKSLAQDWRRP